MTDGKIQVHGGIAYANHDGVELSGDLYLPNDAKSAPALVAVHGGGWIAGTRTSFRYWGEHLAANGIALFTISYRLASKARTFPQAVHDVLAGVQFVRGKAHEFGIDPERIGLIGASAGGNLAALAALGGAKFADAYPQDAFASIPAAVKVLVGVYGVYDMTAAWTKSQVHEAHANKVEKFLGAPPMADRQLYFDASPISYATYANNKIAVFLATGTEDDVVDPAAQTQAFMLALKQAQFFVRPCILAGAPHFWMSDPIDEPASLTGFLAPRLLRFLAERL